MRLLPDTDESHDSEFNDSNRDGGDVLVPRALEELYMAVNHHQ